MELASCSRAGFLLLVFCCPLLLRAEFSKTSTLTSGTGLNVETGAMGSTGIDVFWTGTGLAPREKARVGKLPVTGERTFDAQTEATLNGLSILASTATIASANLSVNSILVVVTGSGNLSKMLVTANSGGSITLRYVTYGVASVPGAPYLKKVLNNSSRIGPGLPNYGIAPSSLFVVTGSGLADPAELVLQSSQPPGLPTTLNGASISVTVGGTTVRPAIYYTSPSQIAAVLPSNTPVGTGTLKVTHGSTTSDAIAIQVVPAALGINTYDVNTGVATDAVTGAVLTYTNSGSPGDTIVLWATGLGANPQDSDTTFATAPHAVGTSLQIYIGGVQARVLYAGSSGYPGVNQINLTIPDNVAVGCWISVAAVAGGVLSNVVTLPIARGGGACLDPLTGLTGKQIFSAGGLSSFRTGFVAIGMSNTPGGGAVRSIMNFATAAFERYEAISYNSGNSVSPGSCVIVTPATVGGITGMDVGTISLTGPGGLSVNLANTLGIKGAFSSNLGANGIPAAGGTFTFKGSGGADVGPFTADVTFASPLLTWTNSASLTNIDVSKGATVTWTGGTPGSFVSISGGSTTVDRTNQTPIAASFICLARVEDGQLTVPSYILQALPRATGGLMVQNSIYAPLSASGLDASIALGSTSYSITTIYGTGVPPLTK